VPVLDSAAAHIECQVRQVVELGDHHVFLGEVVGAGLPQPISGRPDTAVLEMKDLGDSVFYGG
jgi:flavin reductase (DIM6/NTAB) family NADH-FMN oxidoreductase RutF